MGPRPDRPNEGASRSPQWGQGVSDTLAPVKEGKTASTAAREDLREGSNTPSAGAEKRGAKFFVRRQLLNNIKYLTYAGAPAYPPEP